MAIGWLAHCREMTIRTIEALGAGTCTLLFLNLDTPLMMIMIAVITINSGLVPLIEGLCAQILYYIFEIIGGLHIFCFYFSEEKTYYRKKLSVQELILPSSIYIHMCSLYTYTNICMPRFSPTWFFGPSRWIIPNLGLTSEYPICAVCVCACEYTHIHPNTLPPTSKIEKTQTTPLSFLLSKMTGANWILTSRTGAI